MPALESPQPTKQQPRRIRDAKRHWRWTPSRFAARVTRWLMPFEQIQRSGEAFVSNAVIHGQYVLRACIVNFNTDADDIRALPEIVVRHGRAVHEGLQSSGGPIA